jgi:ABC-type sugar transport system ATPase subunit
VATVAFEHVRKDFGTTTVVRDFDLQVADGELVVLVGGSGCGKSTILRMLAGLESITSGTVRIGEREVTHLPPRERNVAMVFQDYALYPHLTARENISLGLRLRKIPKDEIQQRVRWATEILELGPFLDRKPKQMSGGPWCGNPQCSCSMSRSPTSTPTCVARCVRRSPKCSGVSGPRPCT